MIKVYFKNILYRNDIFINSNKGEVFFYISGHSVSGIKGSDIVCAAVSAIGETAVVAINRVAQIRQKIEQRDGFLKSTLFVDDEDQEKIKSLKVILATMIIGLDEIGKNYTDSIKIMYD